MATPGANVQDVDALRRLRAQIAKFIDGLSAALADASSDVHRTQHWLDLDQSAKWKLEVRKRHDKLQQALDAMRQKQLYKSPTGATQSHIDELKAVNRCRAALDEAEQKLKTIASHKNKLSREAVLFQGALARLSSIAHNSGPNALAELGNLITALEKYAKITVDEVGSSAEGVLEAVSAGGVGMARVSETMPMPEDVNIDWAVVVARAMESLARLGGEVVMEAVDLGGKIALVRDGFSGRLYVGPTTVNEEPGAPKPDLSHLSVADLTDRLPDLPRVLERPGERRAYFEGGELAWQS